MNWLPLQSHDMVVCRALLAEASAALVFMFTKTLEKL